MLAGTVVSLMLGVAGSFLALIALPWLGIVMVRS
jgi:hypothetical protein